MSRRINRRTILKTLAGASAMLAGSRAAGDRRASRGPPDTIVAGAGVFGAWIAWHLQRGGHQVRLLDAWAPAHTRASSGGESRLTRAEYGGDELYTRMARESLDAWRRLSSRASLPIFHPVGSLYIFDEVTPALEESMVLHRRLGIEQQQFDAAALAERYPQMTWRGDETALFEPEFGVLMARRAVQLLVSEFRAAGGVYEQRSVLPPRDGPKLDAVTTTDGTRLAAERFIFACGPWLPKLFPEIIGRRIVPVRMEVFFFAPEAGDRRFEPASLPGWVDRNGGKYFYGFPNIEGRGFKIAADDYGPVVDPDTHDRRFTPARLAGIREFMEGRFPVLARRPLTEFRVCQYELTDNADFLIDRHPEWGNVWLVGGGSGHGFKHGPAIGKYVADLVNGKVGHAEPRFALGTRQPRG